jgi:hypothetical protein
MVASAVPGSSLFSTYTKWKRATKIKGDIQGILMNSVWASVPGVGK